MQSVVRFHRASSDEVKTYSLGRAERDVHIEACGFTRFKDQSEGKGYVISADVAFLESARIKFIEITRPPDPGE